MYFLPACFYPKSFTKLSVQRLSVIAHSTKTISHWLIRKKSFLLVVSNATSERY